MQEPLESAFLQFMSRGFPTYTDWPPEQLDEMRCAFFYGAINGVKFTRDPKVIKYMANELSAFVDHIESSYMRDEAERN